MQQCARASPKFGLDREFGVLTEIYLRTIETAQPWASDFGHWLKSQPPELPGGPGTRSLTLYEEAPRPWSVVLCGGMSR